MDKARRKELQREYAERPSRVGVFAVKCAATGQAWVGWSKALDKRKNSLWFQWSGGSDAGAPDILAVWKAHGPSSFSYEILEAITEDNPHKLELLLDERAAHWRTTLNAGSISSL